MDGPSPISERHRAYARAMVVLAREHGVRSLVLDFDLANSQAFCADEADWSRVKMTWAEGRHGTQSGISLRAEAHDLFSETEEPVK